MNERIKELRKALGLTQQKFADKIGVKQNTVAQYEMGRNQPIDTVIALICREFNVNEDWLRYGEGEMFRQQSRNDELTAFMGDLLKK
ncbi:MAG: helix-turn-helix domain-containing protein [Flavonifractor plautii]